MSKLTHLQRTPLLLFGLLAAGLLLLTVGCQPESSTLSILTVEPEAPVGGSFPTLADYWDGTAEFVLDIEDTGLPMGESETIMMDNGHLWSYVHASDRSAGVRDQCGDPVEFPGCLVIYRSFDGGVTFAPEDPPVCQIACLQCPCSSEFDHIDQQQYPDVFYHAATADLYLVYEYRGSTKLRTSRDGLAWNTATNVGETGHWRLWLKDCPPYERIGDHPFVPYDYECLSGAPPGLYIEGDTVYVLVAGGQNPGHMSCWKGRVGESPERYTRCANNPLFTGAADYGPLELRGPQVNAHWDFRTISSAEVYPIGSGADRRYYMLYEGIRGPGPFDAGDTQFGLGMARSLTNAIDGAWEKFPGNPILVDPPANIGLGHADLIVIDGETFMYTSLDGVVRSRLRLVWTAADDGG